MPDAPPKRRRGQSILTRFFIRLLACHRVQFLQGVFATKPKKVRPDNVKRVEGDDERL
jgi:hypothetical protein